MTGMFCFTAPLYCRCRTDVARVERISCEQGLFISPATLQGFKSKLAMFYMCILAKMLAVFLACVVTQLHKSGSCMHKNVADYTLVPQRLLRCFMLLLT